MATRKQWQKWAFILTGLTLLVGLDIAKKDAEDYSPSYSLVDAISAGTKPGMSVVGLIASDYERLENPISRDSTLSEAQVEDMVRYAVGMAGGLRRRMPSDAEWVVIKVNIVELKEQGSGVITDWRVVKPLIKIVHEIVPDARITIVEGPAEWIPPESPKDVQIRPDIERKDGFGLAGFGPLLNDPDLEGIHLDILDTNFDEIAEVSVPDGGFAQDKWKLPVAILENDFLISVPVLKIHDVINMTNAMKNFIGIAPGMVYGWPKMSGYPPRSGNPGIPHNDEILDETITDLVATAEPDFALVDAIMCMERGKSDEHGGNKVRMNAVLASADIVAVDAISAQLLGLNPFDIEYLTLAAYKGIGQVDPAYIKVKGSPLDHVATRFVKSPADWGRGHYGQGNRTWVLKGPFVRTQQEAGKEFIDPQNPQAVPGQNDWSAPVYFHDDRIDLDKYYDDPFDCVVYAYAEFNAMKNQAAEMWIGSDEGLKVWINGEAVYEHEGRRRHNLPNERIAIQIKEGANTLLVRADQTRSRYDFSLNICEIEADERYDGSRVAGLQFTIPGGGNSLAGAQSKETRVEEEDDQNIPTGAIHLTGAKVPPLNDRLLGALAGALQFLGEEISPVQLMGTSGHAFRFSMADSLDWSGSTRIDLTKMSAIYAHLGYQIRTISAESDAANFAQKQQEAWQAITASIDRGMPVVARLGWSHQLIVGYHPKKEQYYSVSSRGGPNQYELDELGAGSRRSAGGIEVLLLEKKVAVDRRAAARAALQFAVAEAHCPDEPASTFHNGFRSFECWIADIEAGRVASARNLGYTNGLVVEARKAAGEYVAGLADDYSGKTAKRLKEAGTCYMREVETLEKLAAMFPERGRAQVDLNDPQMQKKVANLVREAYAWEKKGIASIEEALTQM